MMVRKYIVKDIPEAVAQIRKDLGKDAVILTTHRVWKKRWLGLWRARRVEVIAATGDDVPRRMPVAAEQTRTETQSASSKLQVLGAAPASPVGPAQSDDEVRQLWNEIAKIKMTIGSRPSDLGSGPQNFRRFQDHLLVQGVQPDKVTAITADCELRYATPQVQPVDGNGVSFEKMRNVLADVVFASLGDCRNPRPIGATSRLITFVGPTGVGKTTTIAKLAALHVLEGKRKVGLITADTFRIAAVDQLRTYANILNIPLQVIYEPDDLRQAKEALADRDLILIDTAGRNFTNPKNVSQMQMLLQTLSSDEVHLVASLTSKAEDLADLVTVFRDAPVTQLLLTKLDETRSYGASLNLLFDFKRPLSYITTGQNVPDDIEIASVEKLLRLMTGGARF